MEQRESASDGADNVTGSIATEGLLRELEQAEQRAAEYQDLLRQAKAELTALKRRAESDRADWAMQARVDLLLRVLPAVEELQRCLRVPRVDRFDPEWSQVLEGLERKIRGILESEGIQKIEAMGALYNPWEHEAIQRQVSPELEDQRILAVLRDGYRIGDRVIRPAQVVVARCSR